MRTLWIAWPVIAGLIIIVYLWLGRATTRNRGGAGYAGSVFGILIDDRGRYSLTRLQLALWTLIVLSLTAGVFTARAWSRGVDPLGFSIPAQVLGLLGISAGSAVIATGVKAYKNRTRPLFVAASLPGEARLAQMLMVEEGPEADKIVDITKLQNFLVTIFLAAAYVVLAIHTYAGWGPGTPIGSPADITELPTFSGTFLTLLAISHAGYLGGKLPNRGQDPVQDQPDTTLARVTAVAVADRENPPPTPQEVAAAATREVRESELLAARRASLDRRDGDGKTVALPDGGDATSGR
jgi:hypothetical protein